MENIHQTPAPQSNHIFPKTIIGLMGLHDQGKTATIDRIVYLMRQPSSGYIEISNNVSYLREFLFSFAGKTVGVLDSDYPNLMTSAIQKYIVTHNCDLILCRCCFPQLASTVNYFLDNNVYKMGYRVLKMSNYACIDKKNTKMLDHLNNHSGNQIFETFYEILNGRL